MNVSSEDYVVPTHHISWLNVVVWSCALAVGLAFLAGLVVACLKVVG